MYTSVAKLPGREKASASERSKCSSRSGQEDMECGAEFIFEGKLYVLLFTGYWWPRAAVVAVALQIEEYK